MKKYLLILVLGVLAFTSCSTNDDDDLVPSKMSYDKTSFVQVEDTIKKIIGTSPDFIGTSTIYLQDYSAVLEKTLGLNAELVLEGIAKGNLHTEILGEEPNISVGFDEKGLVLSVQKGLKLGIKTQVGAVLANLKGRVFLKFDVSVVAFPEKPKADIVRTSSSESHLPKTLVTILTLHDCPASANRLEMQCPAFVQLSSNETSKTVTPLFVTDDRKFHVEARSYHLYCRKTNGETVILRVSNSYTYFEDVPYSGGWVYYKGDVPLAFSNGETERINFLYY